MRRRWDPRRRALPHPRVTAAVAAGSRCPQRSSSRHLDATKGSVGLEDSGLASGSPNGGSVASRTGRERCLGAPVGERCLHDRAGARLERPGSDTAGERSQPLKSTTPLLLTARLCVQHFLVSILFHHAQPHLFRLIGIKVLDRLKSDVLAFQVHLIFFLLFS